MKAGEGSSCGLYILLLTYDMYFDIKTKEKKITIVFRVVLNIHRRKLHFPG